MDRKLLGAAEPAQDDSLRGLSGPWRAQPFITRGEPTAADALRMSIEPCSGWPCHVTEYPERVTLESCPIG
jgi:hypothetical protein